MHIMHKCIKLNNFSNSMAFTPTTVISISSLSVLEGVSIPCSKGSLSVRQLWLSTKRQWAFMAMGPSQRPTYKLRRCVLPLLLQISIWITERHIWDRLYNLYWIMCCFLDSFCSNSKRVPWLISTSLYQVSGANQHNIFTIGFKSLYVWQTHTII
jgi:hypothetical protein